MSSIENFKVGDYIVIASRKSQQHPFDAEFIQFPMMVQTHKEPEDLISYEDNFFGVPMEVKAISPPYLMVSSLLDPEIARNLNITKFNLTKPSRKYVNAWKAQLTGRERGVPTLEDIQCPRCHRIAFTKKQIPLYTCWGCTSCGLLLVVTETLPGGRP